MAAPDNHPLDPPQYRPVSLRRRLLILLLAVGTAVAVVLTLLAPPGGSKHKRPEPARCVPGQDAGCLGGRADVIVPSAPAVSPTSTSGPASSAASR